MAMIKCPDCGKEFSSFAKACPQCGCPVEDNINSNTIKCSECGAEIDLTAKACPNCGCPTDGKANRPHEEAASNKSRRRKSAREDEYITSGTKEQNQIDKFIAEKGDFFPSESIYKMKKILSKMDEERLEMVTNLKYKRPIYILLFSMFLGEFGIDRVLLGQTLYGVLKMITGGGCLIWWLIDLFKIVGITKEVNYQKFMSVVQE